MPLALSCPFQTPIIASTSKLLCSHTTCAHRPGTGMLPINRSSAPQVRAVLRRKITQRLVYQFNAMAAVYVLYDAGTVLPVLEANYCHDSLTLALVQDVCTLSGDWDIQDQLVACAEHCRRALCHQGGSHRRLCSC